MLIIEVISLILIVFGIIFKVGHYPGSSVLFIVGMMSLSSLYFYFGFLIFNRIKFRHLFKKGLKPFRNTTTETIIAAIFSGIALSTLLLGIIFYIQRYPGASVMMIVGVPTSFTALVVSLFTKNKEKRSLFFVNAPRYILPTAVGMILLATPADQFHTWATGHQSVEEYRIWKNYYPFPNQGWASPEDAETIFKYDSVFGIRSGEITIEDAREKREHIKRGEDVPLYYYNK